MVIASRLADEKASTHTATDVSRCLGLIHSRRQCGRDPPYSHSLSLFPLSFIELFCSDVLHIRLLVGIYLLVSFIFLYCFVSLSCATTGSGRCVRPSSVTPLAAAQEPLSQPALPLLPQQ